MRLRVGTSGWAYKEWKGSFYPADLPTGGMLRYYAERFSTVEINNTFYRMPRESTLLDWAADVPQDFAFVLKASRRITHDARLRDVGSLLEYFLRNASVLGERLGPTLFQLPPNMKKDLPRLVAFLELLPRGWRAALEFRHPTWFDDEVYDALRARGAALCVADTDDLETPLVTTAAWGYLRLHREAYDEPRLHEWARRVGEQPWSETFVFFKHEDDKAGPAMAERWRGMVGHSR